MWKSINESTLSLFDILGNMPLEHIFCDFLTLVRLLTSDPLWEAFCDFQRETGLCIECEKGNATRLGDSTLMGYAGVGENMEDEQRRAYYQTLSGMYKAARDEEIVLEKESPGKQPLIPIVSRNRGLLTFFRKNALNLVNGSQAVLLTDDDKMWTDELKSLPPNRVFTTSSLLVLFESNRPSLTARWDSKVSGVGGTVCYNNRLS